MSTRMATIALATIALAAAANETLISGARAAEITILVDKAKQKGATGADAARWIPVADGPLKTALADKGLTELDLKNKSDAGKEFDYTSLAEVMFKTTKFGSVGNALGAIHRNGTKKKITDLHIKLLSTDTIKNDTTGGNAFPTTTISADKKSVDFTGGDIAADEFIWSKIPEIDRKDAEGNLTDNPPPAPKKEEAKPAPKTG